MLKFFANPIKLILTLSAVLCLFLFLYFFIFPLSTQGSIDCCYNECQPEDPPKCDGTWTQKCDKCDSDPYYDWCDQTNCANSGQICLDGACAAGTGCTITCATGPGCRYSLANGAAVAGECCSTGDCYDCKTGWSWSGSTCVSICADNDSDGYGNPASITCAKSQLDCDDSNANINPGKTEICDGIDNDCDSAVDEGCACVNGTTQPCGTDTGQCQAGIKTCSGGVWGACVGEITPTAEICDGVDNNCDGQTDEGCDNDDDDYCACGQTFAYGSDLTAVCFGTNTTDAAAIANTCDCNDNVKTINRGAPENCSNNTDDDCDGNTDCADSDCAADAACTGATTCSDGAQTNTCSAAAGAPWYCDNTKNLIENCAACGCSGSWVCGPTGTFCCDNACNGSCSPAVCTVDKDPDCGCLNGNGCCGLGCDNANDNDCAGSCTENWTCDAWSVCSAAVQTRTCADSNNCGTILSKPAEEQFCLSAAINWPSDGEKYNQGDMAWFDVTAFGGTTPYTYKWNSDKAGDFSTEQWPNINTASWPTGIHTIIATVTDSNGQTGSDSIQINIEPAGTLIVNIDTGGKTEFARDSLNPVWFGAQAGGGSGAYTFKWKSDRLAGDFSTEQWPMVDVSLWPLGAHTITVTVTDTGTSETATNTIQITIVDMSLEIFNPMEGATFNFSENIGFNAMAQGGTQPHNYKWKSNIDGDIGAEQFFQKNDLSLGLHTISVTATDSSVTPLNITKQAHIKINPAPALSIIITSPADNSTFSDNESIIFQSAIEGGVWPYTYSWVSNLPDGEISSTQSFTKNDLSVGNHTITLTVKDASGQTATKSINITVNPPAPPAATINNPANNSVFTQFDDTVIFQGLASGGNSPYAYKWSSNIDGDLGSAESFIKNNLSVGNHTITFSVTDANNLTSLIAISIVVNAKPFLNNTKLLANYPNKIMFLISDENWQDVMGLVPLTTWTSQNNTEYANCKHPYLGAQNVCAYPSLIYHKEAEDTFDADSILYFIDQYSAAKIVAINSLPAELAGVINGKGITPDIISPSDYLSYWQNYSEVVYVENNYELALIASAYASLRNAPLVIQGTALDAAGSFAGKKVYTVGSALCPAGASQCVSFVNKQALENEYFDSTATNKVILVNPADLAISVNESFTDIVYCSNGINNLYSKASLAAPFLAGAKHELIISTTEQAYDKVDVFLENKIASLPYMPEFLTIIANPGAIDMHYYNPIAWGQYPSTDQWHYARMNDGDDFLDLATGRIFGISASDISGMIVRTVFYQETLKNPNNLHVGHGSLYMYDPAQVYSYGQVYSMLGYNANVAPDKTVADDWKNEFYIQYHDHGTTLTAGISRKNIPDLDNTFILTTACLTCSFQKAENNSDAGELFCARAVRKGAVGYFGSVDTTSDQNVYSFITDVFTDKFPIGKAFQNSKNIRLAWYSSPYSNMPYETIIGDPTLIVNTSINFPPANFTMDEIKPGQVKYKITVPAVKVDIPQNIKDMCESPASVKPFYISSAGQYSWYNPMFSDKVSFKIPYIPGFNPTHITSPEASIINSIKTQNKKYYFVRLNDTEEPYFFSTANETAFADFDITFTLSE